MDNLLAKQTFELLIEDIDDATNTVLTHAEGVLADEADYPAEAQVEPGTRVYAVIPSVVSLEYVIDQTIGVPGAKVEKIPMPSPDTIERVVADICTELVGGCWPDPMDPDGPFRNALDERAGRREAAEDATDKVIARFAAFLPKAITLLLELAKGVTVCQSVRGKKTLFTMPPSRRAITYILRRVAGTEQELAAVLTAPKPVEAIPAEELTPEKIAGMSATQTIACIKAEEARLAGEPQMPAICVEAKAKFEECLPLILPQLSQLAKGVQTIFQQEGAPLLTISHAPDSLAAKCILNGIIGRPTKTIKPEPQPGKDQFTELKAVMDSADNGVKIYQFIHAIRSICTANPEKPLTVDETTWLIHRAILAS
jgi:hypothetical protein